MLNLKSIRTWPPGQSMPGETLSMKSICLVGLLSWKSLLLPLPIAQTWERLYILRLPLA